MAGKHPERDRTAGPFHSFRVTHVTRAGGHDAGSSEVSTGHLSPAAARDWISQVAKEHKIGQREPIHPAYGVPVDVAEQLGLDTPQDSPDASEAWEQAQLEEQAAAAAASREEESGGDDGPR